MICNMIEKRNTKNILHEMIKKLFKSPYNISWNKGWTLLEKQVSNMGLDKEKEQHRDYKWTGSLYLRYA